MTQHDKNSWRGVRAELLRRITERIWLPGAQIPNEAELALELGCARATVNRAMRDLADAGLLDRRRKGGTKVALNPVSRATLEIPIIRLEVERLGQTWRHELLSQDKTIAPAKLLKTMKLPSDTPLLHLRTRHFADDKPFLYEDRWINPGAVPTYLSTDFNTTCANEWLVRNVPFTTGTIAFSAVNASAKEAEWLETKVHTALFVVDRLTWNAGQVVTSVKLTYAPGYKLGMAL